MAPQTPDLEKPIQHMQRRKTVIALRSAIIIFSLIGVGQLISILAQDGARMGGMVYFFITILASLSASLLWSCVDLFFIVYMKKSIRPGTRFVVSLITWLILAVVTFVSSLPMMVFVGIIGAVIVNLASFGPSSMGLYALILELCLFVWACRDRKRLKKSMVTPPRTPLSTERLQKEKNIKIGLRGGILLFGFIAMVLHAYTFSNYPTYSYYAAPMAWFLIVLLIWSGIDTSLYLKNRSIHPGIRVALDLIFWWLCMGGTQNPFEGRVWIKSMSPAMAVLDILVMILEFALFVWACVDTSRYNRKNVGREGIKYEMVGSEEV